MIPVGFARAISNKNKFNHNVFMMKTQKPGVSQEFHKELIIGLSRKSSSAIRINRWTG